MAWHGAAHCTTYHFYYFPMSNDSLVHNIIEHAVCDRNVAHVDCFHNNYDVGNRFMNVMAYCTLLGL